MNKYKHLTLEEREKFFFWYKQGVSFREIGRRLRRSHTIFRRELNRNSKGIKGGAYLPCHAQRKADKREVCQREKAPLKEPFVFLYVRKHLRPPYSLSPELIAGRLALEHPEYSIDDETIYRYIYGKHSRRDKLWRHLTRHRKHRMVKSGRKVRSERIQGALRIDERPIEAEGRSAPGHWETDNMEGKRSDKTSVSVTVERMTRITRLAKLVNHLSETKADALIKSLRKEPPMFRNTLTSDNGPENAAHKKIASLTGVSFYLCYPYHSWEKGSVENMIGRIRRFIPKGRSIDNISEEKLKMIENILNNTPRKCLSYLTPNEVYERMLKSSTTH